MDAGIAEHAAEPWARRFADDGYCPEHRDVEAVEARMSRWMSFRPFVRARAFRWRTRSPYGRLPHPPFRLCPSTAGLRAARIAQATGRPIRTLAHEQILQDSP